MYKNFNITESEKEEILNRLKENGYGQPINEQKKPPFNGKGGTPQPPSKPTGLKYKIDPKLSVPENIKNAERTIGRPLNPLEVDRLVKHFRSISSRTPKHTPPPSVDKNDLTGDNKGEGVNLYSNDAQTMLKYSATIDKIVKSGSGFDIFVSGDYEFADKYFHWEPKSPYFQAFVKSTRKPLTWEYNGKMRNETVYNKEFSSVLQNMVAPTPSPTNNDVDFVSGNVNEQTAPSKYGTAVDSMDIIKEKIMGKPVRFFMDKELKTPAYNGEKFTFSKVEKDGSDSTKFNVYFKEFSDPLTFKCETFKDALYRSSKREFLYNTTLYKYLTTALCNTELSNDGKVKSVPNVKYAKNDTQGLPNQTGTLAENKKQKTNNMKVIKLTESELKDYIKKIISEQINPDYSKGTHDIDARGEKYLPLAQKLAKQLKEMKFTFNGKNIFKNTFDGFHVTVEFNNQGVNISKVLEKKVDTPNLQAPLVIPYEKLTEMNFMKYIVDYVRGTQSKGDLAEQGGKRPHDKMVVDCLTKAGFKSVDTKGKYAVYLKKGDNIVTSQSDPTKFAVWGTHESQAEELVIGTSTNCQIIVATALGYTGGKR